MTGIDHSIRRLRGRYGWLRFRDHPANFRHKKYKEADKISICQTTMVQELHYAQLLLVLKSWEKVKEIPEFRKKLGTLVYRE
jgi:hypothetical protein